MKKLTSILLALVLVFSFAACSNSSGNGASPSNSAASAQGNSSAATDESQKISSNGKVLVVYYSATGSTKAVAETVARAVTIGGGADLFEITPVDPYTSDDLDWTDDNSRVSIEHNDESKRDVPLTQTTPDNWADYDTVFIGYPIWWGIAAWPVNNFVKGNDFSDKTVIPFCTSASSGLGQSGELLADMAGTGDWQKGERFSSNPSSKDVEAWVIDLGC